MKQTWRWFGPNDLVSIDNLLQIGVEGVVTALHHIAPGQVWSVSEIKARQKEIAFRDDGSSSGLTWDVVESLPVSESIKTQTGDWAKHIAAYKQSLRHLASCGLKTVCYNFMPVLDWTRTTLRSKMPHGGYAMQFDLINFAIFDLFLLERAQAYLDYSTNICEKASIRFDAMSVQDRKALEQNIVAGLPGANDHWTLENVRNLLDTYKAIDAKNLRNNLISFLEHVVPVAAELDINLCCHPDDPPFPLLGLPRIMSTLEDYAHVMKAVDIPQNGITLCTGSLGVDPSVNFEKFIADWGHRIHFVHLRNTTRQGPHHAPMYSFYEAEHLGGDTDIVSVIAALLKEESKRRTSGRLDCNIPMRPDHGQEILDDIKRNSLPGYPMIGRARGLAELRGVICALNSQTGL